MKKNHNLIKLTGLLALSLCGAATIASCGQNEDGDAKKPQYTLSFYVEGAKSQPKAVKYAEGDAIKAPSDARAPSGYSISDWHENYHKDMEDYEHSASEKAFDFSKGMPAKNLTLYAHLIEASASEATQEEIDAYIASLKANSTANHLYYHYYRFGNAGYEDWDVWAWPYKPNAGEGCRFDWVGRTQAENRMSASGDAIADPIGGAYIDIDLNKTYDHAGWDADEEKMLDGTVNFGSSTQIGLQIVNSSTRKSSSGFWVNDGSNVYIKLDKFAMDLDNGGKAYHVFVLQDSVSQPKSAPITNPVNPFKGDKGEKVTYGVDTYNDVEWGKAIPNVATADDFKSIGAGYQIQISSFADSDGDGFGDIYGITQKLDYLKALGVKALWLTPVQLSDSYHGYDITDYKKVDPKFGSKNSPAGIANNGEVTEETAMADYEELIQKAGSSEYGMKVVMDLVLNHTSTANNWYTASANLTPEYRGYYQWGNHDDEATKDVINEDKSWYPYGDHKYSYYAKFGSGMPELNYSYKATREAVEDMSAFWVNKGVAGFRLDAVKHIYMLDETAVDANDTTVIDETTVSGRKVSYSSNLTKNLNFFKELKYEVSRRTNKNVFFVGENFDGHAYHVAPYYESFDSMFDFYAYFNFTSSAATGLGGNFGTAKGFMTNESTYTPGQVSQNSKGDISGDTKGASYHLGSNPAGSVFNLASGKKWNFLDAYSTYNAYRAQGGGSGQVSLPGAFTSNHDIARVINRVAGTTGNALEGLDAQGTVNPTAASYSKYERSAMLVKIAEVMLPGVTWIYYGDEIGMTGNFPNGKDSQSDYADLWYRQPMKWATSGNQKGDANGTTDYYVTGSKQKVEWDSVNSTSLVVGAMEQMNNTESDFNKLANFVKAKNADPSSLVTGNIAWGNWCWGNNCDNILCISRGGDAYRVVVNFTGSDAQLNDNGYVFNGYHVVASYNGADASHIPGYSAVLLRRN